MKYYAADNPYGRNIINQDGNTANTLYTFSSKRDRDDWVDADWEHRYPMDARRAYRIMERERRAGGTAAGPIAYMDA